MSGELEFFSYFSFLLLPDPFGSNVVLVSLVHLGASSDFEVPGFEPFWVPRRPWWSFLLRRLLFLASVLVFSVLFPRSCFRWEWLIFRCVVAAGVGFSFPPVPMLEGCSSHCTLPGPRSPGWWVTFHCTLVRRSPPVVSSSHSYSGSGFSCLSSLSPFKWVLLPISFSLHIWGL